MAELLASSSQAEYLAIIGPSASGKSALALQLAAALPCELINCDSVQLYRGFNIGAAKPSAAERQLVPHHLLDHIDWFEDFDARLFAEAARKIIAEVKARGKIPILVGGTGLYLRALWQEQWHDLPKSEELRRELNPLSAEELRQRLVEVDPERAQALHPNDRFRLQRALEVALLLGHPARQLAPQLDERHRAFVIRVRCPRAELQQRIELRTELMLKQGLIEEVRELLAQGVDPLCKPMQSIGYAQVGAYLQGQMKKEQVAMAIIIATRQYAKRQETWFNKVKTDAEWTSTDLCSELINKLPSHLV